MSNFLQRGGLWVLGQGALLLAVAAGGVVWRAQWDSRIFFLAGVLLSLAAAGCGVAGVAALGKGLTPFPRPSSRAELVQRGIYGLMRHPLYTAVICASGGWALLWRSWPALVAALALVPFFRAKACREEAWLRQQFPQYAAYERRVRRFLPWI